MGETINGLPVDTGDIGAHNQAIPSTGIIEDSVHDYFHKSVGESLTKEITLAGNAGPESVNIAQLTGSVEIVSIHGFVTDTTTLVNLTGGHLELWDSAAAIDITKNDGVLSGMAVGTLLVKNAAAGTTIAVADNVAGALTEGASLSKAFAPFFITQKTGANTYIRWTYTTTDAPIAAKIEWHIRFRPEDKLTVAGTLVAV